MPDYDEDRKLIEYRFGQMADQHKSILSELRLLDSRLAALHLDMTSQRRVWKTLFAISSVVGTTIATCVGWFIAVWTSKP